MQNPKLEIHEIETGPSPKFSIIWLHGLGADGFDFAPIVPELVAPNWPGLRFVFPHAPVQKVTINNGYAMRSWYDIVDMDLANRADLVGVAKSVQAIEQLIDEEIARGFDPSKIVLAGFSQGGAIALSLLISSNRKLAGVIALSTYLPAADRAICLNDFAKTTPVFMAHGLQDPVVPTVGGQTSAEKLQAFGIDVQWHTYPMQHQTSAQEIADLRQWLSPILTA